ncbi:hypothetical protein HMPREF1324_1148 [Rothia aeria F0474]|uniref:Uncharacterized protein n=1 Tax=Rothia aeria F0474 TaxID=1125724 RepID=I0URS1_9MICC|nr:hypothetical protein HMPREF1324_1148 [Rothia aeria F0474]
MFPAYVGMSPARFWSSSSRAGVPRIRGDEPKLIADWELTDECSPHTWG